MQPPDFPGAVLFSAYLMKIVNALIASVVFIIGIELLSLISLAVYFSSWEEQLYNYTYTIIDFIELAIIIFVLYKIYGWKELLPNEPPFYYYILAAVLGFLFVHAQEFLGMIYDSFMPVEDRLPGHYELSFKALLTNFQIGTVLLAPLSEELFFRRYIQHELQKEYSPVVAIVTTSLLFAMVHLPFASLMYDFIPFTFFQAYIALFGGAISGILYYKSKSIIPSVVFHIFWNFTVGGFIFVWE